MSDFKDAVANDVFETFMNLDEFADEHDLNGRMIACVIDQNLVKESKGEFVGVFVNTLTIRVSSEDYGTPPVEGEILMVDDSMHLVRSVSDEMGVLVIICEAHEE